MNITELLTLKMYPVILRCLGTLSGEATLFIFASHLIRDRLLMKRICSHRSKFFPVRVDPVLKGLHYPGKKTGSHKSCFP